METKTEYSQTKKRNKFGNKRIWIDPITLQHSEDKQDIKGRKYPHAICLDSQLELQVYVHLRTYFPWNEIKIHYPIEVRPATPLFCQRDWRIDFICNGENGIYYVEAKGVVQRDFYANLMFLETYHPEILDQLWLVSQRHICLTNSSLQMVSIEFFKANFGSKLA